jgi:hypothetical protein
MNTIILCFTYYLFNDFEINISYSMPDCMLNIIGETQYNCIHILNDLIHKSTKI